MENVKKELKATNKSSIFERIFLSNLKKFTIGRLHLTLPSGEVIEIGDGQGIFADLKVIDSKFFKNFVLYGDVGFGESYVDGYIDSQNITDLIRWAIQNIENSGILSGSKIKNFSVNLLGKLNKLVHLFNKNSESGSKENISYHYDLSNDFYETMLDETMMYSCGVFEDENSTLKESQLKKLDLICNDLNIQNGDHILEIGCGWGGFAIHAVTNYGCKVTGVTISKEQYDYAVYKVKRLGLQNEIEIKLLDYRKLKGKFDKIVSIEMIEAVGHEFLPTYFQTIDKLLKPNGVAVIQAITSPDSRYNSFRKGVDFIQKHIFPGSLLPSVGAMTTACKKTNLHIHNLRDIGTHYAKTLNIWNAKVFENKEKIKSLGMDEVFFRKWKYYLNYCEAAFIERNISDVQITFIKPNNTHYKVY